MASTGTTALAAQVKPLYPAKRKSRKQPKTSGRKKQ